MTSACKLTHPPVFCRAALLVLASLSAGGATLKDMGQSDKAELQPCTIRLDKCLVLGVYSNGGRIDVERSAVGLTS